MKKRLKKSILIYFEKYFSLEIIFSIVSSSNCVYLGPFIISFLRLIFGSPLDVIIWFKMNFVSLGFRLDF